MTYFVCILLKFCSDLADSAALNCFYWLVLQKSVVKNFLFLDAAAVDHIDISYTMRHILGI